MTPQDFPRRCLLMTVGLTPQVVTETFYALATRAAPDRFVPTEIHLITTEEGSRQAELGLLDNDSNNGNGQLSKLCAELGLARTAVKFDRSTIHTFRDANGMPMEDIRSNADNHAGADAIAALVRALTADDNSALHVSLAGGRKTMGFYLGYALSLFGRAQDGLSHVLVDQRFEGLRDFFFPTRNRQILLRPHNQGSVDSKDARVELADIPVVSLRGLLGADLLGDQNASYADIVRRARAHIDETPSLTLDLATLAICAGGEPIKLGAAARAWFAFFVLRAARAESGIAWRTKDSSVYVKQLDAFIKSIHPRACVPDDIHEKWIVNGQLDLDSCDRLKTRVNDSLKRVLGPGRSSAYQITRESANGQSLYRIALDPSFIQIKESHS